ncbi:unnamed protein product (macronuclear) [Paramecium tetraurelia]|uniref:Uncharacterized protein n=1 Tax=Paramecium tetraurelia TaxID=5888 RepID=A0EDJ4_PARTE|nr:uncharacterized protein GSPATT00025704001 [Paramecium tetraurelia]CAK93361.1 unnamed protein product [Paramecium tetraurelia]|eukprot:XP_001460758.1 hypothetical protein (macronuclear) [Paramecium tetraurelia strain d4-2]
MKTISLLIFIIALGYSQTDQLRDILDYSKFDCDNLNDLFEIKNQLLYWNELKDTDLIQQISDILEVKESLLNYKELLLSKSTLKKSAPKVLLEKVSEEIKDIVQELQNDKKELTLQYCDNTIRRINKILDQRDSEKNQLFKVEKQELSEKLKLVTEKVDTCNRSLKPAYHNKIILQQMIQSKTNEVGYGYWFRLLNFYPEDYQTETYFISRVSENENYSGNDLGDNKLVVSIQKKNLVFSTYDIKTMNSIVEQKLFFEKNQWVYIHFSYQDGLATGYVYLDQDDISKIEFHVEHFKLNQAYFKFGGNDLQSQGLNGQFAQLTYGVGKQYITDKPQLFIEEVSKLSPQPQFNKQQIGLIAEEMQFPIKFKKEYHSDFIDEFAISAWFKIEYLDAENIEIFRIKDDKKNYALSFYGGNSLSFGTYSKDQELRKAELFEQTDDWHYIYMSYSYLREEFNCFVWINGHIIKLQEHNVKHYPTTDLTLSIEKEFDGQINKLNLYVGQGSHINDPHNLPSEYQVGLDLVENSIVRSFKVTKEVNSKNLLNYNSNMRGGEEKKNQNSNKKQK